MPPGPRGPGADEAPGLAVLPPAVAADPAGAAFGIYLHVLFCLRRCPYCDFTVAVYREDRVGPFLRALAQEIACYATLPGAARRAAGSLFLGGGTPSLLSPGAVAELVAVCRRALGLREDAEVTLEANPEGLDAERLRAFRAAGVTRLSLGVQSLDETLLRRLGRGHSAADARRAFAAARAAGFASVSVDLLYGVPGQSLAAWTRTLEEVLAWGPDHLSAYLLTLEPGTAFGRRPPPDLPEEAVVAAQYETLVERAAAAGLERYEVSNFARPGHRSRHNLLYWRRQDYLGLGPGAHGAVGTVRWWNLRSLVRYRQALDAGRWPIEGWEELTAEQVATERLALGLRLADGVPRAWLEEPPAEASRRIRALRALEEAGLLETVGNRVRLTLRGVLVSDAVTAALL